MKPMIRPRKPEPDTATEFREYLKIDKDGLDEALAQQADLFFRVAEEYAFAISEREEAKEALNTVDAETGLKLRIGKKEDEKMTEGSIKDWVQKDPQHKLAFDNYARKRRRAEQLAALKEAFQERGRMLRDLGNLYATGYFTITASKGAASRIGRERLAQARQEAG